MSLSDALLIPFVLLWLAQTGAFFAIGEPVWGTLWTLILGFVLIAELISKLVFGRTITQRWKAWAKRHKVQAVLMLIWGFAVPWILLIMHLSV